MWFKNLFGFQEVSPDQVRSNFNLSGEILISKANNRSFNCGTLSIETLHDLQLQTQLLPAMNGTIFVSEVVADVQDLHCDPKNHQALFQVASQFNLLEMVGPGVTPEYGIDGYEHDYTQGPACAMACGAATVYRNYFVPIKDQIGQTETLQIDCLDALGEALDNGTLQLWEMRNGYALPSKEGLIHISNALNTSTEQERDALKAKLKIGIHWNTEVTLPDATNQVSQVFSSALPVAYLNLEMELWEGFARLVLEASYEATLHAALLNYHKTGSNLVYLTLIGGGAFGNSTNWIIESLNLALKKFKHTSLDVRIVSYLNPHPEVATLVAQY